MFVAGCSDSGPTETRNLSPLPVQLQIVSGGNQLGKIGEELPDPVRVRVIDSSGRGIATQVVNFRVVEGGGSVFAGTAVTDQQGYAADWWTLGSEPGMNVLEARAVDPQDGQRLVFARFTAEAVLQDVARAVEVTPDSVELVEGAKKQFSAVVRAQDGSVMQRTVDWSSSDASIASVDTEGMVTAVSEGVVQIRAEVDGATASAAVVVQAAAGEPPATPSGLQIETHPLSADSFDVALSWNAQDGVPQFEIKTGSASGWWNHTVLTSETSALIRAPYEEDANNYWLCVRAVDEAQNKSSGRCNSYQGPPPPAGTAIFDVTPDSVDLANGTSLQLGAVVNYGSPQGVSMAAASSHLHGTDVHWSSASPSVATVSDDGMVSAVGAGRTVIIGSFDGMADSSIVSVLDAQDDGVVQVVMYPTEVELDVGETAQLLSGGLDSSGQGIPGLPIHWISLDSDVATVDATGIVSGVSGGVTWIRATIGGESALAKITVAGGKATPVVVLDSLGIAPKTSSYEPGAKQQYAVTGYYSDGSTQNHTASAGYALTQGAGSISSSGLFTAGSADGQYSLVASLDGKSTVAQIVVEGASAPEPPAKPSGAEVTATYQDADSFKVDASWAQVSEADRYRIQSGASSGSWSFNKEVTSSMLTFRAPFQSGATFWFCVAAVNAVGSGESFCSDYEAPTAPASPQQPEPEPQPEPLVITTPSTLPSGTEGEPYNQTLSVTGGDGSQAYWFKMSGTLPSGLSYSQAGAIAGTPNQAGTFSFTLKASNGQESDTRSFQLTIEEGIVDQGGGPGGGGSAGVCASAGSDPVAPTFCEDFSSYRSTSDLRSDPNGWFDWYHAENISLDRSAAAPGYGQSVRYRYQAWNSSPNYGTPQGKLDYSDATGVSPQEVWGEVKFRFSGNFTMNGHPDNPVQRGKGFKLLFNNYYRLESGFSGPSRFQMAFHNGDDGELTGKAGGDNWSSSHLFKHGSITDQPSRMFDGKTWHTIRWHIRVGPGGSNVPHIYEWWFDGVYQGIMTAPAPGSGVRDLTTLALGVNLNNAPPADQYLWWQHVKLWYSNPGW